MKLILIFCVLLLVLTSGLAANELQPETKSNESEQSKAEESSFQSAYHETKVPGNIPASISKLENDFTIENADLKENSEIQVDLSTESSSLNLNPNSQPNFEKSSILVDNPESLQISNANDTVFNDSPSTTESIAALDEFAKTNVKSLSSDGLNFNNDHIGEIKETLPLNSQLDEAESIKQIVESTQESEMSVNNTNAEDIKTLENHKFEHFGSEESILDKQENISEPQPLSSLPESVLLGQINLNLLPPLNDPAIKQFQFNMSLPLFNQLELCVTLQEMFQGETAPQTFETVYQIGALFGNVPEIIHGNLSLLSGTLTVTSAESIQLDNLSSSKTWKTIHFQLHQASADLILVGKVEKSAPSSEDIEGYRSEMSFQIGPVSGNYRLRLEKQIGHTKPCPWISLDHELITQPADILYFHSFIDHICGEADIESDGQMNIEIELKSALWPLANFYLNQTFNFGSTGDELMHATHPLFDIGVSGFWNGDSVFSKTLKLNLTTVGSHLLPLLPSSLKAIFTRYQLDDGSSKSYTVNVERSSESESQSTSNRLSLSSLVTKITAAFITATTVVFSANGALFSGMLSQIECLIYQALVSIEQSHYIPVDIFQFQLALELVAFLVILWLVYFLLSFTNLFETVLHLSLIVIFVEICVATIGVQLITLGFL